MEGVVSPGVTGMSFFTKLRIGARLALCFGVVVFLIVGIAAWASLELSNVRRAVHEVGTQHAERMQLAQEWRQAIVVNSQRSLAVSLSGDLSLAGHFDEAVRLLTLRVSDVQERFLE